MPAGSPSSRLRNVRSWLPAGAQPAMLCAIVAWQAATLLVHDRVSRGGRTAPYAGFWPAANSGDRSTKMR